jgi:hypothetical protein
VRTKALAGIVSQNQTLYLAFPSLENLIYGASLAGAAGQAAAALYAQRLYPIPERCARPTCSDVCSCDVGGLADWFTVRATVESFCCGWAAARGVSDRRHGRRLADQCGRGVHGWYPLRNCTAQGSWRQRRT